MKYFQKLKGERIYLSPFSESDVEIYTKWVNDRAVSDNLGITWISYDIARETEFMKSMREKDYHFAIVKYDGDILLGNVGLFNLNYINRTADFGIFIGDEEERGRGYGTEAARLILDYGFNVLNINNVILKTFAFNSKAIACYERLGFKKIGVRRQAYFLNGEYHDDVYMDIMPGDLR